MKTTLKIIAALAIGGFAASCAEQDVRPYVVEKPETVVETEYLNSFGNIKDYLDRAAYPNFRVGAALEATDYLNRGVVFRVGNANFDELTTGNAMKYGSCVGDDGTMNFGTVTDFLAAAKEGKVSVYGHTLAWHAQQNVNWLNTLIADIQVPIGPEDLIVDKAYNFADYTEFPFPVIEGCVPEIKDGILTCTNKRKQQYYLAENVETELGETYEITIMAKANKELNLNMKFGDATFTIPVSTEWAECQAYVDAYSESSSLLVTPGNVTLTLEVKTVRIGHYPPASRPQTPEEKKDTLAGEMRRWCKGMMEACNGQVKSWDLINEAISGAGSVEGKYYELQHDNGSGTDFFWQDYLGDENYGPIVSKAARDAYQECGGNPDELKLFVNDYNLESDWDQNRKVKSLVYWVGVWEKKGAKIDGLSSQMHVSYYENKDVMRSKANAYVNMLKIMVESGKLVRISELDMGYVDIFGEDVATDYMTPEQHLNMAHYYQFIIDMYLKLVPKDQQYGICQWCLTDAPSSSGWRANTPVGLWDLNWDRKVTYVAWCEAFKNPSLGSEDYFKWLEEHGYEHYVPSED